jgi:hypothetical protein
MKQTGFMIDQNGQPESAAVDGFHDVADAGIGPNADVS